MPKLAIRLRRGAAAGRLAAVLALALGAAWTARPGADARAWAPTPPARRSALLGIAAGAAGIALPATAADTKIVRPTGAEGKDVKFRFELPSGWEKAVADDDDPKSLEVAKFEKGSGTKYMVVEAWSPYDPNYAKVIKGRFNKGWYGKQELFGEKEDFVEWVQPPTARLAAPFNQPPSFSRPSMHVWLRQIHPGGGKGASIIMYTTEDQANDKKVREELATIMSSFRLA